MNSQDSRVAEPAGLEFLWLELTNRCNLECVHCYADSAPSAGHDDVLNADDYEGLLSEAAELGTRRVQFIGGEPTLNHALPRLIASAKGMGYELVEVYSNLINLSEELLDCFAEYGVGVATSIYGHEATLHDQVTRRPGSFQRTVNNVRRVIARDLRVRAAMVIMPENAFAVEATRSFLLGIGVQDFGTDRLRAFGRAAESQQSPMNELCGSCAAGTLCVGANGVVYPCIMSKAWAVGSVQETSLGEIATSDRLQSLRRQIHDATRPAARMACTPDRPFPCSPDYGSTCNPCSPNQNCGPNDCRPKHSRQVTSE